MQRRLQRLRQVEHRDVSTGSPRSRPASSRVAAEGLNAAATISPAQPRRAHISSSAAGRRPKSALRSFR